MDAETLRLTGARNQETFVGGGASETVSNRPARRLKDDLDDLENNVDVVEDEFDYLEVNVDVVEENLDVVEENLDVIEDNLDVIEDNLDVVEDNLDIVGDAIRLTSLDLTARNRIVTANRYPPAGITARRDERLSALSSIRPCAPERDDGGTRLDRSTVDGPPSSIDAMRCRMAAERFRATSAAWPRFP